MIDIELAVVVPAGPRDDVVDTVRSILHWTTADRQVVVVDDSGIPTLADELTTLDPTVTVIPAPGDAPGAQGGLWVKIAAGYRQVAQRYAPRTLLRIDADALVIGPHPERDAEEAFAAHPEVGLLGSFRLGSDGGRRDFSWPSQQLRRETSALGLRHPGVRRTLRSWLAEAERQGYETGEHALGGAYFHSGAALRALYDQGRLDHPELADSGLGEDHLFALATVASGFRIGDFALEGQPLGLRWKGLPAAPDELVAQHRKVVHSVRSYGTLTESDIRTDFANRRSAG
jgi:hypothetical protein